MQLKSCGFLIFRSEPRVSFLLMRHPDRFDLPKGHVDEGETEEQCALRELWEETGITAEQIEVDDSFRFETHYQVRYRRTGGALADKTLVIFIARLLAPVDVQLSEHGEFLWHDWSPPHDIQANTINPLLAQAALHFGEGGPFA